MILSIIRAVIFFCQDSKLLCWGKAVADSDEKMGGMGRGVAGKPYFCKRMIGNDLPAMEKITISEALSRAESRCAQREMCCSEVKGMCQRWGLDWPEIEEVVKRLEAEGYVDEGRYAQAFAHDKAEFDRWGPLKIRAALRAKAISEGDCRQAVSMVREGLFAENLRAALASKRRALGREEDLLRVRDKLLHFAVARGYEPEMVFGELDAFTDLRDA